MKIINRTQGTVVGSRVRLADTWWGRFWGFLGRGSPSPGEGILLAPCNSIHTFGMRFDIDVIFLSADGEVLSLRQSVPPWRICRGVRGGRYVLEIPSGTIEATSTRVGDELSWATKSQVVWWRTPSTAAEDTDEIQPKIAIRGRSP
jgi:uncharacterized membrane protein (UPF0127 family)